MRPLRLQTNKGSCEKFIPCILVVLSFLLFFFGEAESQPRKFSPTITNFFGNAELNITYESNSNTFRDSGRDSMHLSLEEKLNTGFAGYVYHPRFIIYQLSVGAGLTEEYFKSENFEDWHYGFIHEYDARVLFLPRHKYNLELYSKRRNPFIEGRLSGGARPVFYQHGANLFYKTRPLSLNAGYSLNTIEAGDRESDSNIFRIGGNHIYGPSSTGISYNHTNTDSTTSFETKSDYLLLSNEFAYKRVTLNSNLGYRKFMQDSPQLAFTDTSFNWSESLGIKIFKDLDWNANLSYLKFDRRTDFADADSRSVSAGSGVYYRFYKSIRTHYHIGVLQSDSTDASSETLTHSFSIGYTKRIPTGMLYSSFSTNIADIKITGPFRVFGETHSASLMPPDDRFSLKEPDANEKSIIVRIIEPETGVVLPLFPGTHYIVETIGNQTFITIISLIGVSPLVAGEGPFNFTVDYTALEGDTEFKTFQQLYTVKLELFENLLSPYYSFATFKQDVIEGEIPGGTEDSKSHTFGLGISRSPFFFNADYQIVESRLNPQKRLTLTGDYYGQVTQTLSLNIKTRYQEVNYEVAETERGVGRPFDEELYSASARLNGVFPKRNITAFAGSNYTYRKGRSDSYGISFNSGLVWRKGRLRLNSGLNVSHLVSKLPGGDLVRDDTFIYFRATRELF